MYNSWCKVVNMVMRLEWSWQYSNDFVPSDYNPRGIIPRPRALIEVLLFFLMVIQSLIWHYCSSIYYWNVDMWSPKTVFRVVIFPRRLTNALTKLARTYWRVPVGRACGQWDTDARSIGIRVHVRYVRQYYGIRVEDIGCFFILWCIYMWIFFVWIIFVIYFSTKTWCVSRVRMYVLEFFGSVYTYFVFRYFPITEHVFHVY